MVHGARLALAGAAVKFTSNDIVYEGINHLGFSRLAPDEMVASAPKIMLVWSDGEWELWAYEGTKEHAERELRRYYFDSYGWPETLTKVYFYSKD